MTDYWLSKLFFDLQQVELRARYRADRRAVIERYPLNPEAVAALLRDDVAALAPLVNPYLLRYYFSYIGMPDNEFMRALHATTPAAADAAKG
jgi:Aromatic-ring-opening dioxygenase LigAB, LigA subunit